MFRSDSTAHHVGVCRRALTFLFALCLLIPAGGPPAVAGAAGDPVCTGALHPLEDCAHSGQRSADKAAHGEVETLPGTPDPASRRALRRWYADAAGAAGPVAAVWLSAPAHDPPRTIRYCSLLL